MNRYADGNQLKDENGKVLGTFSSHWAAVAAMIRMSNPEFKSLGGDSRSDLEVEATIGAGK